MKTAIVCVLFSTAALAAANNNYMYQGSNLPMDHNDDIYNRDFPSLVFNFEQLRRDQPPQVENRQEDLGRYMYRPRPSTTIPPPMLDFPKDIPEVKILPEHMYGTTLKPYTGPQIINRHLPPTIPPPPATPQWMDLSDTMKHQHHSRVPVHVPQAPTYNQGALPERHAEPVAQPVYPQYSGVISTEPAYVPTTKAPYAYYMQDVPAQQHMQHFEPSRPSRGHHKFSWSDVTPTVPSQPMMTTPATVPQPMHAQRKNPPSSIPTLTPWSGDSFGK